MQSGEPREPVTLTYFRVTTGETYRLGPRLNPSNSVVVDVTTAESAPNLEGGKALARETIKRLADGEIVGEERPYVLPAPPERVTEIDHSKKMLRAIILRWPDEYEILPIGYVPNGYTLPVATPSLSMDPDFEWGRLVPFERLLCDTLDEAMEAAQEELARLADTETPIQSRA